MTEPTFHLMIPEAGRADVLLAGMIDGLTRSAAQRWLEEGRVVLEGRPVKKNARLEPGQVLSVTPPQPEAVDVIPQDIPLDAVYEDGVISLQKFTIWNQRAAAPGHRPPHRPGHLRPCDRGQKRPRPPGPGRAASGPLPVPPLPRGGAGGLSG